MVILSNYRCNEKTGPQLLTLSLRVNSQLLVSLLGNTAYISLFLGRNLTCSSSISASTSTNCLSQWVCHFNCVRLIGAFRLNFLVPSTGRQDGARVCTTPANESGLCRDLSDCPDLILNLENFRESICFKPYFAPGVCCPKTGFRWDM